MARIFPIGRLIAHIDRLPVFGAALIVFRIDRIGSYKRRLPILNLRTSCPDLYTWFAYDVFGQAILARLPVWNRRMTRAYNWRWIYRRFSSFVNFPITRRRYSYCRLFSRNNATISHCYFLLRLPL